MDKSINLSIIDDDVRDSGRSLRLDEEESRLPDAVPLCHLALRVALCPIALTMQN